MLRPGGTLAVWGYDLITVPGEPEASAALRKLYSETLDKYWDSKRKLIDTRYAGATA